MQAPPGVMKWSLESLVPKHSCDWPAAAHRTLTEEEYGISEEKRRYKLEIALCIRTLESTDLPKPCRPASETSQSITSPFVWKITTFDELKMDNEEISYAKQNDSGVNPQHVEEDEGKNLR